MLVYTRPLPGLQLCRVGQKTREVKRRRVSFQQVKDLPAAKQPRTELDDEAVSAELRSPMWSSG